MVEMLNLTCFENAEQKIIKTNLLKIARMTERIKYEDKPVYSYIKEKLINCVKVCKDQEAAMSENNV